MTVNDYLIDNITASYADFIRTSRKLARETAQLADEVNSMTVRFDRMHSAVDQELVSKVERARATVDANISAARAAGITEDDIQVAANDGRMEAQR